MERLGAILSREESWLVPGAQRPGAGRQRAVNANGPGACPPAGGLPSPPPRASARVACALHVGTQASICCRQRSV